MKLNRLRKNMRYIISYGGAFKMFKKNLRASPDKGLSRIPARKLKAEWNHAELEIHCMQLREDIKVISFGMRYGASYVEETFELLHTFTARLKD